MAFFKRGGKGRKDKSGGPEDRDPKLEADADPSSSAPPAESSAESSPQRVGIVSGVLSTTAEHGEPSDTLFGDVVGRRFGPTAGDAADDGRTLPPQYARGEDGDASSRETPDNPERTQGRDSLRVVEQLFPDQSPLDEAPALEVDPMAHIGRATTITGNIVSEEDLEIQGTVEGSVRLANHQVTIGAEGHVKASVDAEIVMVYGKVTGDIIASDLVEIEKGGIVGGDVKAPRIIMHDGAIVVGRLDMSAALPNGGGQYEPAGDETVDTDRPHLTPVFSAHDVEADDADGTGEETSDGV